MSHKNPGAKEHVKRRKLEEGSVIPEEKMEESGGGGSDSTSSRVSMRSLMSVTLELWGNPRLRADSGTKLTEQVMQQHMVHYKETGNLFRYDEGEFKRRAGATASKEWVEACGSLMRLSKNDMKVIEELPLVGEVCEECDGGFSYTAALVSAQFARFRWALRECSRRYLGAEKAREEQWREKEEAVAKNEELMEKLERLTEEMERVELEREQLRAALAAREEHGGGDPSSSPEQCA